jgi:uncharacterized membrane protein
MLPDPIHPAIVHFPIVLSVLLPLLVAVAFILARRGTPVRTAWLAVVGGAAMLAASAWVAVETGEQQEERVEQVVTEAALDTHQDRATLFLWLTVGTLVVTGAGLARGRLGRAARASGAIAALAHLPAGYLVGHSGGELVYKYGAAQAYIGNTPDGTPAQDGKVARGNTEAERDDKDR